MTKRINKAAAVFGTIAGGVSIVAQVLTVPGPVRNGSIAVLVVAAGALAWSVVFPEFRRHRRASAALPSDRELATLSCGYTVTQATREDIAWISQQEADVYSPTDAIPLDVLREWFDANPCGFSVIRTADGQRVGHINMLPLKRRTCEKFVAGEILEREIRGDSVFGAAERHLISSLYVESVAVCVPRPLANVAALGAVLGALPSIVERVADPEKVEVVYAIAASVAGDRLMRRLGFEVLKPAGHRKDGHDFFSGELPVLLTHAQSLSRAEHGPGVRAGDADRRDEEAIFADWISRLEACPGPAARRATLQAALNKLSAEATRQRLLVEASHIEVAAVLEKVDGLNSVSAKRRHLGAALDALRSDSVPDELQSQQIRWLEDALRDLERHP